MLNYSLAFFGFFIVINVATMQPEPELTKRIITARQSQKNITTIGNLTMEQSASIEQTEIYEVEKENPCCVFVHGCLQAQIKCLGLLIDLFEKIDKKQD